MKSWITVCLIFQLSKLEFEGIYHPTPLLKLLHTCATNRRYHPTAFILYLSYIEFSVMDHALILENFIESNIFHFINSIFLMCWLFHFWNSLRLSYTWCYHYYDLFIIYRYWTLLAKCHDTDLTLTPIKAVLKLLNVKDVNKSVSDFIIDMLDHLLSKDEDEELENITTATPVKVNKMMHIQGKIFILSAWMDIKCLNGCQKYVFMIYTCTLYKYFE